MNIFFDSIHLYLSLRTYINHSHSSGCELNTNNRINRDETILFKNGFYPMSLSRHIETLFEQLAYHCRTENPLFITREEFVKGYNCYEDAGCLFDNLSNNAECLNSDMMIDVVLSLQRYQIRDLMSCIFMTTSIDLSRNEVKNNYREILDEDTKDSGNCDTPILLHSDVSDNSTKYSFESCKDTDKSELYITQCENVAVYSICQQLSPISLTTSFNLDKNKTYIHKQSYPTLDITGYTNSIKTEPSLIQTYSTPSPNYTVTTGVVIGEGLHSIDLSNQISDISNTNSTVTLDLPEPDTYSLDTSFSSSLHPKQKETKSIGEWLCKCSIFSSCTRS